VKKYSCGIICSTCIILEEAVQLQIQIQEGSMSTTAVPPTAKVAIPDPITIRQRALRRRDTESNSDRTDWLTVGAAEDMIDRALHCPAADRMLARDVEQCYAERGQDMLIEGLLEYVAVADELVDPDPSVYTDPPAASHLSRFLDWREKLFGMYQQATFAAGLTA
jgi:hypothetical protein